MKARIIIGANYGDEGKGTVVANYTKKSSKKLILNVLTNGGSQRGHSILVENGGNITFQHFGSGTYHGADNYYSRFFILNPMQFVKEYEELPIKPKVYRDLYCRWSTPYDVMANLIIEQLQKRKASCGMGIWNTIKRYEECHTYTFGEFACRISFEEQLNYLNSIKSYYERKIDIPDSWKSIWNSIGMIQHFISDCSFMYDKTDAYQLKDIAPYYDEIIFENGQGLLLCDTGKDNYDTTPSNTGIAYSLELLKDLDISDITAHYVTRPYLTRHGDGLIENESSRCYLSGHVERDRTNHYNNNQGAFRYGKLDLTSLSERIKKDAKDIKFEVELTHCDEMDRVTEFNKVFNKVNIYDTPIV